MYMASQYSSISVGVRPFKDLDSYGKFFATGLGLVISSCSRCSTNLEISSASIHQLKYEPLLLVPFVAITVIYLKPSNCNSPQQMQWKQISMEISQNELMLLCKGWAAFCSATVTQFLPHGLWLLLWQFRVWCQVSWGSFAAIYSPIASYSLSFLSRPYRAFKEDTLLFLWPSSVSSKMSWLNPCGMTASRGPLLTAANSFSSQQVILKQAL